MTIKNTGDIASNEASATLSTTTPLYVTVTDSNITLQALTPNQSIDLESVFGIVVADNIPDHAHISFNLAMNDGGHQWTSTFSLFAASPILKVNDVMIINDSGNNKGNGNGRLDPGETAEVTMNYSNFGSADVSNVTATLSSTETQYITISNPNITTPQVNPSETIEVTYTVSVSAAMPKGEDAALKLTVAQNAGNYGDEHTFTHRVGLEIANFEQGLDGFEWENDPSHPWVVSSNEPWVGTYCLQSGSIGNNETSTLTLLFDVENLNDEIRFYRKTDSEMNGDFLRFYIDGTMMQEWSGSLNWREMVFPVMQGEHTFSWVYEKNSSGSSGSDHAWIDEILFPVRHIHFACNAGADQESCQEAVQLEANAIGYESLLWTTAGDGSFNATDILDPIYNPGEQDLINKAVNLTLTATNESGETLTDDVTIHFHEAASIEMDDQGDICESESISLSATVSEAGFVKWETEGDGEFSASISTETTYTPGAQDIANGSVNLKFVALSPYGCGDAEYLFLLNIHPIEHSDFNMEACGSYNWNGTEYNEDGDYEQTLQSIYGCDSIVTMHLTLIEAYQMETEFGACDSYEWGGETFTESGIYEHTFTSMHGCDSIVTMNLTIYESYNPSAEITMSVDACDSYEWDGIVYTESGIYERIYTDIHGCDSTVVIDLGVMTAPVIETINGDTEVDVRLTPTSVYSTAPNGGTFWSLDPEEAGTVIVEEGIATVTWSETFKGDVILHVWALGYCGEDESSMTIHVKNSTGMDEHNIKANIYPNPTNGNVTIEAEGLRRIIVSNAFGQIILDRETQGNHTLLNMSQFAAGTYLIRIHTDNGIAMKRVNVIK